MKAILEFNLEDHEERKSHLRAARANDLALAFWEVTQQVFRPARKHGYPAHNEHARKLKELMDGPHGEAVTEAIWELEQLHLAVIREEGIESLLDD